MYKQFLVFFSFLLLISCGGGTSSGALPSTTSYTPVINSATLKENSTLSGEHIIDVDITDGSGITDVQFTITNKDPNLTSSLGVIAWNRDTKNPSALLSTKKFTDGLGYVVTIKATNNQGRNSEPFIIKNIAISNVGSLISSINPIPVISGTYINGSLKVSAIINDPIGLKEVKLVYDKLKNPDTYLNNAIFPDGYNSNPQPSDIWTNPAFSLDSKKLTEGKHLFTLIAKNSVNAIFSRDFNFIIDNTLPVINIRPGGIFWTVGDSLIEGFVTETSLKYAQLTFEGVTDSNVVSDKIFMIVKITKSSPEGSRPINFIAEDLAGNITRQTKFVIVDHTPPTINVPVQSNAQPIGTKCKLNYTVNDTGGSGLYRGWIYNQPINPKMSGKNSIVMEALFLRANTNQILNIRYDFTDNAANRVDVSGTQYFYNCGSVSCFCGIL